MKSIVASLLVVILLVQVSVLNPVVFNYPEIEHGSVHNIIGLKKQKAIPSPVLRAVLTSKQDTEDYDSLIFVGDVLLGRNVEYLMDTKNAAYPFSGFSLNELTRNPALFGNFESAIADEHFQTPAYTMRFSTNPEYVKTLSSAGFTHLSLANNHSLDYGVNGYLNSLNTIQNNGIIPFGCRVQVTCDSSTIVNINRVPVGVVALDATGSYKSAEELAYKVEESSKVSDFQIVYIHWGDEYQLLPNNKQRRLAEQLITAGADLIIGHHPHTVQNIELINDIPVIYSLGNYIFDQYFSTEVQRGLVATLQFAPEPSIELVPVSSIGTLSQPRPMSGDEKAVYLYEIAARSDERLRNEIARGTLRMNQSFATSIKTAMIRNTYVY